jgi:hypothetical protein
MKTSEDTREYEAKLGGSGSEASHLPDQEYDCLQGKLCNQALATEHLTAYEIEWAILISTGYL